MVGGGERRGQAAHNGDTEAVDTLVALGVDPAGETRIPRLGWRLGWRLGYPDSDTQTRMAFAGMPWRCYMPGRPGRQASHARMTPHYAAALAAAPPPWAVRDERYATRAAVGMLAV